MTKEFIPMFDKIVSFIKDIYKTHNGKIPLHAPVFAGNEKKYMLVFGGEITEGEDLSSVKKKLALLYKVDVDRIDSMFRNLPKAVKKNLDWEKAELYRKNWEKAGAICRVLPMKEKQKSTTNEKIKIEQLNFHIKKG